MVQTKVKTVLAIDSLISYPFDNMTSNYFTNTDINGRKYVELWRGSTSQTTLELTNFYAGLARLRVNGQKGVRVCYVNKVLLGLKEMV